MSEKLEEKEKIEVDQEKVVAKAEDVDGHPEKPTGN